MTAAQKLREKREAQEKEATAVPQRSLRHKIETITPEIATRWLERNPTNRRLNQEAVDRYARDMKQGRWHVTGDSIKFGFSGILLDGQHRLWAGVLAGVPFDSLVVRGIVNEAEVRDVIDTGMRRTLGNALQIHGEKDANHLAAIIAACWRYDLGRLHMNGPTHEEGLEYLNENPLLRDAVLVGRAAQRGIRMSAAAAGAAYFLNARSDEEESRRFWDGVATGEGLTAGDPILAFRRWVIMAVSKREKPRPDTTLMYALKAMNLWREGRQVRMLQLKDVEGVPKVWS